MLNERVQMFDKEGKLITQSLKDYTKQTAKETNSSHLDNFIQEMESSRQEKSAFVKEMVEQGIFLNELQEEVGKGL